MARKKLTEDVETQVLTRSRRRRCLCYFFDGIETVVDGQIAHLDQNNQNSDCDNLAFLCLRHHNIYDSRTSVSKGLRPAEVKHYRARLYEEIEKGGGEGPKQGENPEQTSPNLSGGDFLECLDGLNGDELYILAKAVLIQQAQTFSSGPYDPVLAALKDKHFLKKVSVTQTLLELKNKAAVPYTILPAAWRHLNDRKRWLLNRAKERNRDRAERLAALEHISFDDSYV